MLEYDRPCTLGAIHDDDGSANAYRTQSQISDLSRVRIFLMNQGEALGRHLLHNHPSGDPTPSRADTEITREIVAAADTLGLKVHDHLVIGRHGAASLRQLGLM